MPGLRPRSLLHYRGKISKNLTTGELPKGGDAVRLRSRGDERLITPNLRRYPRTLAVWGFIRTVDHRGWAKSMAKARFRLVTPAVYEQLPQEASQRRLADPGASRPRSVRTDHDQSSATDELAPRRKISPTLGCASTAGCLSCYRLIQLSQPLIDVLKEIGSSITLGTGSIVAQANEILRASSDLHPSGKLTFSRAATAGTWSTSKSQARSTSVNTTSAPKNLTQRWEEDSFAYEVLDFAIMFMKNDR